MLDQTTAATLLAFIVTLVGATKFLITVGNADTQNNLVRLYACLSAAVVFAGCAAAHASASASAMVMLGAAGSGFIQGFVGGGAAALAVKLYHVAADAGAVPSVGNVASAVSTLIPASAAMGAADATSVPEVSPAGAATT